MVSQVVEQDENLGQSCTFVPKEKNSSAKGGERNIKMPAITKKESLLSFSPSNKTGNSILCFPCCSGHRFAGFHKTQFLHYCLLIKLLNHRKAVAGVLLLLELCLCIKASQMGYFSCWMHRGNPQHHNVPQLKLLQYCNGMLVRFAGPVIFLHM